MRQKITILAGIAIFLFSLQAILPEEGTANGSGAPTGNCGSPFDNSGSTCTSCHGGAATTQAGMITTDIPPGGYIPGATYNITVTVTQTGKTKFGFQLTSQNSSGTYKGTLIAGSGSQITGSTKKYATHTLSGTSGGTGSKSWTFQWTAPATGTGDITFYAAGNAANGDFTSGGDVIYKFSLLASEGSSTAISETWNGNNQLRLVENPLKDELKLHISLVKSQDIKLRVVDLQGRVISDLGRLSLEKGENIVTRPIHANPGVYFLVAESGKELVSLKFLVI